MSRYKIHVKFSTSIYNTIQSTNPPSEHKTRITTENLNLHPMGNVIKSIDEQKACFDMLHILDL